MTEWFERWFGETYLELYPHRDGHDAAAVVALVSEVIPLNQKNILDLACGPARHAAILRDLSGGVLGLDLSYTLLRRAREDHSPFIPLVCADMRNIPFAPCSFDVVVNLFTSFGYFASDDQHQMVVNEVARVLNTGGHFVLDYFNAARVREELVKHEERTFGNTRVSIERHVSKDGLYVVKDMHLIDDGRRFQERVRLFDENDIEHLLVQGGFAVQDKRGSYSGESLSLESPRVIMFSELR